MHPYPLTYPLLRKGEFQKLGLRTPELSPHIFTWDQRLLQDRGVVPAHDIVEGYRREFIITAMNAWGDLGGLVIEENPDLSGPARWQLKVFRWSDGNVYEIREVQTWRGIDSVSLLNNSGLFLGAGMALADAYLPPYHPSELLDDFAAIEQTDLSPTALSDSGLVAGSNGVTAFVWNKGVITDIGALPGGSRSFALGVSDNGAVFGLSDTRFVDETGHRVFHPFRWNEGKMTDLAELVPIAARASVDLTHRSRDVPPLNRVISGGAGSTVVLQGRLKTGLDQKEGQYFLFADDSQGKPQLLLPVRENGERFLPSEPGENLAGIRPVHAFEDAAGKPKVGRIIASVDVHESDKDTGRINTIGKRLPAHFVSNSSLNPIILEACLGNFFPASYKLRSGVSPEWKVNGRLVKVNPSERGALISIPRDQQGRIETTIEILGEVAWSGVIWIID